jgi:uncharacterized protein (DUF885 family)
MKSTKKIIFSILSITFIFCSIWTYKLIWGKPFTFNHFVERVFIKFSLDDPELLSFLGSIDNTIIDFHSNKLTDISAKQQKKELEEVKHSIKILHSYNQKKLDAQEKITYEILDRHLNDTLEFNSFHHGYILDASMPYPVNQLFGIQSSLPEFMISIHQIINKKSANNYISRLSKFGVKFDQLLEDLKLREKNGIIPPRFVIEKVLNELNEFINQPSQKNILYSSFKNKLDKITKIDEKDKIALEKKALETIKNNVLPAYTKLIKFLQNQKQISTNDDGIWKIPNGDKFYAFCLKMHTTTDYSPQKIHEIGISEVASIQTQMKKILDELGYKNKTVAMNMQELSKDKKFLYENTENGRRKVLDDFRSILNKIKKELEKLFTTFPKKELEYAQIPAFKAKTSPAAYYEPPSLDNSRPGTFFVNTHDLNNLPKFTMPSLAYHEGIPGHHFQISIAQEIKKLPTLRRITGATAYVEGWALYCEQLAWENGFITDPYSNLGRLQMEMLRAVRLVVDTGLHYKRWTREKAIDYMSENTGMPIDDIIAEVERYIVLPGQACAYKIGMMKILELREKAKTKLGKNFDIRKFHDIILKNGAMPLYVLEKYLDYELSKNKP